MDRVRGFNSRLLRCKVLYQFPGGTRTAPSEPHLSLELSASTYTDYNRISIMKDIARTTKKNISAVIWIEVKEPTYIIVIHT